jgi:hypothetical protein
MDYRLIITLVAMFPMTVFANSAAPAEAKATAEGIVDASASAAPRLEIRKYRFFHDTRLQRERLVLEFERRDFYHESKPRVSFEALSSQEIIVRLENAVLMGAIPESLINDSYAHQSKFMGPISMDDRSMSSGLAMKMKLKDFDLAYKAEWLSSPARLVIDVFPKTGAAAKNLALGEGRSRNPKSLRVERKNTVSSFGDFMCFPAKSKVGLAVVFQAGTQATEDLQKFRVNIDGSNIGLETHMDQESIVCYPKTAQVKASLSFQGSTGATTAPIQSGTVGGGAPLLNLFPPTSPSAPSAPAQALAAPLAAPAAAAPVTGGSDTDLDPGHLSTGNGATGNEERGTASSSPASLLPPL